MNEADLNSAVDYVNNNSKYIEELTDSIVEMHCQELDDYIKYVKALLDDVNTPIRNEELDDIVLTIPTLLYFVGSVQETLGIREDVAKMDETFKYNKAIIDGDGTIAVKQAFAKLQTKNESLATIVYQRACKKVKYKCDYALEILQSCKKILSRRQAELELSQNSFNRNVNN